MMPASLSAVARHLLFVRETTGPNLGAWVEHFQRFAGGVPGENWCADFLSFVLDIAYRGQSPLPRTGSTHAMLNTARLKDLEVEDPAVDDVYFFVNEAGEPHHVGIVTGLNPLIGLAGNTSLDGNSSNGTGVFEHRISATHAVFVRLPK